MHIKAKGDPFRVSLKQRLREEYPLHKNIKKLINYNPGCLPKIKIFRGTTEETLKNNIIRDLPDNLKKDRLRLMDITSFKEYIKQYYFIR